MLFWLACFETLVFITLSRGQALLLLSVGFLAFLFRYWGGATALEDYVDVPVSFFALLSVGVLVANEPEAEDGVTITLALMLAGGAAMTKQVGLYMLAAVPLLTVALAYERHRSFAAARRAAVSGGASPAPGVSGGRTHVYLRRGTIRNGTNTSELSYLLNDQFSGRSYAARMGHGFGQLFNRNLLRAGSSLVLLTAIASLRDRTFRWVFLIISVPFLLIWSANFSYDTRNLTLALPFWALCSAAGVAQLAGPRKIRPAQPEPAPGRWLASRPALNAAVVCGGLVAPGRRRIGLHGRRKNARQCPAGPAATIAGAPNAWAASRRVPEKMISLRDISRRPPHPVGVALGLRVSFQRSELLFFESSRTHSSPLAAQGILDNFPARICCSS